jgi:hypothetical protein
MALAIPENVDQAAVQKVCSVVESLRSFTLGQRRGRRSVEPELEVRFCLREGGGLNKSAWMGIVSAMDACEEWDTVVDWSEIVDFFFTVNIDGDLIPIRTSRSVNGDGKLAVTHLRKDRVNQCFVGLQNCASVATSAKVIFSTEETLLDSDLPKVTPTTNVRIKNRKSYTWGSWRFDVTKSWAAPSYSQATNKRDAGRDTGYEVEIELADTRSYLDTNSTEYVALSMLMKICGVLPPKCQVTA